MTRETKVYVLAIFAGAGLGLLTSLADRTGGSIGWLGSLTAPWLLVGYFLGFANAQIPRGMVVGAVALTTGIIIYYLLMHVIDGSVNLHYFQSISVVWLALAPLAGAVAGAAGVLARGELGGHFASGLATGIVEGVIAGEVMFFISSTSVLETGETLLLLGFIVAGASLPALLRTKRARFVGYGSLVVFAALGLTVVPGIRFLLELTGHS